MSKPTDELSLAYLAEHMAGVPEFDTQADIDEWAIAQAPAQGCAVEFGVGYATTLARFAKHKFTYGFDSFQGLPEAWHDLPKGAFGDAVVPDIPNTEIIVGDFADTVPKFVAERPQPVAFVHVDCDLYASAVIALKIAPLLVPNAVILFDEYFSWPGWQDNGEHTALLESGLEFDYIGYGYCEVAVRITSNQKAHT